jgi:RecA/RadA recombinase
MNFLQDVVKEIGNEYAGLVSDGVAAGDCDSFVDTGSYIFNALVSGSIYGGIPSNKITAIAGESSTGKTFFCLSVVKHFLDSNPNAGVVYFESESAITKSMIEDRGIDSKRMIIVPVVTVQEFRTQSLRIVDKYLDQKEKDRQPLMFVLDSLGNLSTTKEIEDSSEGKETRDMTRAQVTKSVFRVLTLKLGKANIPMLVTNHTYDVVGAYVPTKEMGGGSGLKYAASTIIYLSKSKEKDGKEVIGNIIKCKAQKSRFTKENSVAETRLYYDTGLDPYYGLLELGEKYGVFERVGNRYKINGTSVYPKSILADPEKYFTPDIMQALDESARKEYLYGQGNVVSREEDYAGEETD